MCTSIFCKILSVRRSFVQDLKIFSRSLSLSLARMSRSTRSESFEFYSLSLCILVDWRSALSAASCCSIFFFFFVVYAQIVSSALGVVLVSERVLYEPVCVSVSVCVSMSVFYCLARALSGSRRRLERKQLRLKPFRFLLFFTFIS